MDMTHDFKRFQVYLEECFFGDPRLALCQGAKQEEIERLMTYADRPLPQLYLDYLRVFGENDGPLRLGDDCSCAVSKVLRYRQSYEGKPTAIQPPNAFRFTNEGASLGRSLLYRENTSEPCVVMNDLDDVVEVLAETFPIFLFRQAWKHSLRIRTPFSLDQSLRGDSVTSLDSIERVALERGFHPFWFSDRWALCAEKGEVSLTTQFQGTTIFLFFDSPLPASAQEECDAFQKALGYINQKEVGNKESRQ